jgi:hypothetical protein
MRTNSRLACIGLLAVCVASGCGGGKQDTSAAAPSGSGGDSTAKLRICLLPKIKGIAYFSSCAV